jgi:hypothetical protein
MQFATEAYLADRGGRGIAPATLRKYTTLKQLRAFATEKGYVLIEQIQITAMDEPYSQWKDGLPRPTPHLRTARYSSNARRSREG